MGLDVNGVRFLFYAEGLGSNFERTAMIGRQSLDLTKAELKDCLKAFGKLVDSNLIDSFFKESDGYAEQLIRYLGARSIHSFDFSKYEEATHVHDMNQVISSHFSEKYSVVLDGGSLEHIFNVPVAIKNCMEMLEIGGHYLGITPANNFMGHGFYQFSPEMYFSVFNPTNGFELISLIAFEDKPGAKWYSVKNPGKAHARVLLVNDSPVYLLVTAKKLRKTVIFASMPQQSDYLSTWKQDRMVSEQARPSSSRRAMLPLLRNWIKQNVPFSIRHLLKVATQGYGFNPRFFLPVDPIAAIRLSHRNKGNDAEK